MILRLAWRNLWRNPRRTGLMIAIVAFGVAVLVMTLGFSDGVVPSIARAEGQVDFGYLQIRRAGYGEDPRPGLAMPDGERVRAAAAEIETIAGVAPRLDAPGLAQSAYGSVAVDLRGLRPADETRVTRIAETVTAGRFLTSRGQAVLPRRLAERLDLRIGERFVLTAGSPRGLRAAAVVLVGVVETGVPRIDETLAFTHFDDLRDLVMASGPTAIVARTPTPEVTREALRRRLGAGVEIVTLREMAPLIDHLRRVVQAEMVPVMVVLALLMGIGVANTMLVSVLERTREFGVMQAVGMRPRSVAALVVAEAVLAALLGFGLGGLGGLVGDLAMARRGVDLSVAAAALSAGGGPGIVHGEVRAWYWGYALAVVLASVLLAAWGPARRVARTPLRPVLQVVE